MFCILNARGFFYTLIISNIIDFDALHQTLQRINALGGNQGNIIYEKTAPLSGKR